MGANVFHYLNCSDSFLYVYTSIVIKVSMLNMFSLLNVNKAVKEREEREGVPRQGEKERVLHGIGARRSSLPEAEVRT